MPFEVPFSGARTVDKSGLKTHATDLLTQKLIIILGFVVYGSKEFSITLDIGIGLLRLFISIFALNIMERVVFFDWDCTITQAHMYSMFARASFSSRTEMGRFLTRVQPAQKEACCEALTCIVDRLKEHYHHWGSSDEESVSALQGLLGNCQPLLLPAASSSCKSSSESVTLEDDLRLFLFGNSHRQEALTNMFAQLQSQGKLVTFLTKGIGACVLGALMSLMPQWLGEQVPPLNAHTNGTNVPLIHCIAIVDYAGLRWHAGNISRVAPPCIPKLAQISVYCAQFSSTQVGVQKAMLIDDSAPQEIDGMKSEVVGATSSWKFVQVTFDPKKTRLRDNSHTIVQECGVIFDCIAGGPRRNGNGLVIEDCAEIVRVSNL